MRLRFWIDPETGVPHIYGHAVTETEVRQVLSRPRLSYSQGERTRIVFGQTSAGRPLKVVFVPDDIAESGFVVTAYELRGKALKAYRRAMRRNRR
jgi:hypothetical protein